MGSRFAAAPFLFVPLATNLRNSSRAPDFSGNNLSCHAAGWNRYVVPGMVGRLLTGQTIKQAIAWGKDELEGFVR